nr:immunoglobulin heavy chain junction region [Macaca mulatta]
CARWASANFDSW